MLLNPILDRLVINTGFPPDFKYASVHWEQELFQKSDLNGYSVSHSSSPRWRRHLYNDFVIRMRLIIQQEDVFNSQKEC
ncbi:MAG: hypothetical protein HGB12_13495 [Bacteroidetes bacterium]|nr:hypothetical protein [Bacteroidota bacterium]